MYIPTSVTKNIPLADSIFSLTLTVPAGFSPQPGQFVQVYTGDPSKLLARPLSVCDCGPGWLRLVYQIAGGGTAMMSDWMPGRTVQMLGPLGNGFPILPADHHLLVGGGVGIPPLLYLAREIKRQQPQAKITAALGFRSEPWLVEEMSVYAAVVISTDDGSRGFHGNVVDYLRTNNIHAGSAYACGPKPMLRALAAWAGNNPCFLSLEERMACGLGACVGCVVPIGVKDNWTYKKVCQDGPVFDAREVVWDA